MVSAEKQLSKFMKFVFWFVVANSSSGSLILILFPTQTEKYFFWNITPPINAMLVGAMYLVASATVAYAAIRGTWESARLILVMGFSLSVVLLVTSLMHIDRFVPGAKLYYWLFVYFIFPVLAGLLYWRYEKGGTNWQVTRQAVKPITRLGALTVGTGMLTVALVGFFFPSIIVSVWPWKLSDLMLRVFLSWLIALAAGNLWFLAEKEWTRLQPVSYMLIALPVVVAVMMMINRPDLTGNPLGLLGFSVGLVLIGTIGVVMLRQQRGQFLPHSVQ
ncbi:MAG: hypothetical protein H7Y59_15295 [Anaerolineales bacterium]|nr:hypothetical protein [Anaerolineales bacterium]